MCAQQPPNRYLSSNPIEGIPEAIGTLRSLQALGLSNCSVGELPESLAQTQLRQLLLSGNALTAIPRTVFTLATLKSLDLSANALADIGPSLPRLPCLTELVLDANPLHTLPPALGALATLQSLSVSATGLETLPDVFGALPALQVLVARDNALRALPESLTAAPLEALDLTRNAFAAVPALVQRLPRLRALSLDGNRLAALPEWLGALAALEELRVSGNAFSRLPHALPRLSVLTASDAPLYAFPPQLAALPLHTLVLAHTRLTALPAAVLSTLTGLRSLVLDGTWLTALPPALPAALQNLQRLSLRDTCLDCRAVAHAFAGTSATVVCSSAPEACPRCRPDSYTTRHCSECASDQSCIACEENYTLVHVGRSSSESSSESYSNSSENSSENENTIGGICVPCNRNEFCPPHNVAPEPCGNCADCINSASTAGVCRTCRAGYKSSALVDDCSVPCEPTEHCYEGRDAHATPSTCDSCYNSECNSTFFSGGGGGGGAQTNATNPASVTTPAFVCSRCDKGKKGLLCDVACAGHEYCYAGRPAHEEPAGCGACRLNMCNSSVPPPPGAPPGFAACSTCARGYYGLNCSLVCESSRWCPEGAAATATPPPCGTCQVCANSADATQCAPCPAGSGLNASGACAPCTGAHYVAPSGTCLPCPGCVGGCDASGRCTASVPLVATTLALLAGAALVAALVGVTASHRNRRLRAAQAVALTSTSPAPVPLEAAQSPAATSPAQPSPSPADTVHPAPSTTPNSTPEHAPVRTCGLASDATIDLSCGPCPPSVPAGAGDGGPGVGGTAEASVTHGAAPQGPIDKRVPLIVWFRDEQFHLYDGDAFSEGSFGDVYKVMYQGSPIAIKVLKQCGREEVSQEMEISTTLKNKYIVTVYCWNMVGTQPYCVMEYAPHVSLFKFWKKYRFSRRMRVRCMLDVCEGMNYLHQLKIIHRDLKPGNVLWFSEDVDADVVCKFVPTLTHNFVEFGCFLFMLFFSLPCNTESPTLGSPNEL